MADLSTEKTNVDQQNIVVRSTGDIPPPAKVEGDVGKVMQVIPQPEDIIQKAQGADIKAHPSITPFPATEGQLPTAKSATVAQELPGNVVPLRPKKLFHNPLTAPRQAWKLTQEEQITALKKRRAA